MDVSALSINGLVGLAQHMKSQQTQQDVQVAVQNLARDQQQSEGQQVLNLIQSADGLGQIVNVMA